VELNSLASADLQRRLRRRPTSAAEPFAYRLIGNGIVWVEDEEALMEMFKGNGKSCLTMSKCHS
jgi:hypothetical protein